MNRRNVLLSLLIVNLLLVLIVIQNESLAQSNDYLYFPETDHSIRGEFLEKFNSVLNPVQVFGYPITEAIIAPSTSPFAGKQVQYFQRAIFEYRPANAPGHRVQLVALGKLVYEKAQFTPFQSLPSNQPACETFPNTGFKVCYSFLNYFNDNGGLAIFGSPISDMVVEKNRIIQYFEFARFEWRPELASGHRVVLTNLGELYFHSSENQELKNFRPESETHEIRELHVNAFPVYAVISNETTQSIYVVVKDQLSKGVPGAQVTLFIIMPDKQTFTLLMPRTNDKGITSVSFTQPSQPIGRVEIIVEVNYANELTKKSRTSYRIW